MADNIEVPAGATIGIQTTGGGGWGDPLLREPRLVAYDVECGLVSERSAAGEYGVILNHEGPRPGVDKAATDARRMELRARRGALPMFDRGPYVEAARAAGGMDWPEGWQDPDAGWWAETTAEAAE